MLASSTSRSRSRFFLGLLALAFAGAAALGLGVSSCSDACVEDPDVHCIVGHTCVEKCGGPVISQGCCACAEGTFDTSACEDAGTADGG